MARRTNVARGFLYSGVMLGLTSCSTMTLDEHPEASSEQFLSSQSKNGLSIVAQPLLGEKESKEYFGVNLLKSGILAVHLTVRNDNPNESFLVLADSVQITQISDVSKINDPERGDQKAGETIGVAGVVLISPILLAIAVQQLSDATIIEENFEANKLRTTTIDPGEKIAGFSYFSWEKAKIIDTPNICLDVVNPVANVSFPYCFDVAIKGETND